MTKRVNSDASSHAPTILDRPIGFVKYQARRARSVFEKAQANNGKTDHLISIVDQFDDAVEKMQEAASLLSSYESKIYQLENQVKKLTPQKDTTTDNTFLTPADIEGAPPELLEQLSLSETDRQDFKILRVMEDLGGQLSLDKILVTLYNETGEVLERSKLNQRLYRMIQKGHVFPVPGRKGVYTTAPITDMFEGMDEGQDMD